MGRKRQLQPFSTVVTCPSCGQASSDVIAGPRPIGLPWFACPSCRYMAFPPADVEEPSAMAEFGLQWTGGASPHHRLWEKLFHQRLTNPITREREIRSLEVIGNAAIPYLSPLAEHPSPIAPALSEAAVEALGRIGGPEATNTLLRVLQAQEREALCDRRVRLPVTLGTLVVFPVILAALYLFGGGFSALIENAWMLALLPTWFAFHAIAGVRRSAANALGALQVSRAAGALAMAHRDKSMRDVAERILIALLPNVSPEDVQTWAPDERAAVADLLRTGSVQLKVKALPLIALYAGSDTLPVVEALAKSDNEELASAAVQALPPIQQRAELERDRATLLRAPSDAGDNEQLLRPAFGDEGLADNLLIARPPHQEEA